MRLLLPAVLAPFKSPNIYLSPNEPAQIELEEADGDEAMYVLVNSFAQTPEPVVNYICGSEHPLPKSDESQVGDVAERRTDIVRGLMRWNWTTCILDGCAEVSQLGDTLSHSDSAARWAPAERRLGRPYARAPVTPRAVGEPRPGVRRFTFARVDSLLLGEKALPSKA